MRDTARGAMDVGYMMRPRALLGDVRLINNDDVVQGALDDVVEHMVNPLRQVLWPITRTYRHTYHDCIPRATPRYHHVRNHQRPNQYRLRRVRAMSMSANNGAHT